MNNTDWFLYSASFEAVSRDDIYVHYNSGAGEGVLPRDAVVNNIPYNQETNNSTISFATGNETVKAFAKPEATGTFSGYIFDEKDARNELEKAVVNDTSSDTLTLNLYYKPTTLVITNTVKGYNPDPNKSYKFSIQATAPDGAEHNTLSNSRVYIRKGSDSVTKVSFDNNQAAFELKKEETVTFSCLPTGWSYTIQENDVGTNYTTAYKLNNGAAVNGTTANYTMWSIFKTNDSLFIGGSHAVRVGKNSKRLSVGIVFAAI